MMEAERTSETSVDNYFTRQYNPEDSSEHHTRRRENLKSHNVYDFIFFDKRQLRYLNITHYSFTSLVSTKTPLQKVLFLTFATVRLEL
jgi:hypothetical protein